MPVPSTKKAIPTPRKIRLLARRRLAALHARVVECVESLRELGGIVAVAVDERRVALEDAARIPGAVLRPHQIAPPDLGRIEAERTGDVIHGRFHDEVAPCGWPAPR